MKRHRFCLPMVCLLACALALTTTNVSTAHGEHIANVMVGGEIVAPSVPLAMPLLGSPSGSSAPSVGKSGSYSMSGPSFVFTKGPGIIALEGGTVSDQALAADVVAGFQTAGNWWSSLFSDQVTINLTIDFQSLGSGILGSTSNVTAQANFDPVKTALGTDATTADDASAVASLQPGTSLDMLTNDTSVTPSPVIRDTDGSPNNFALDVPRANLKALGLLAAADPAEDGAITFSSNFTWDFDSSNGVSGFDFVGVAAHEIGHLMGFVSGVDTVDYTGGSGPAAPTDIDIYRVFSVLDLYRYSDDSLAESGQPTPGAVLDLAYGGTPYFSLDAGTGNLAPFSTGSYNGDGRQASHWKDSMGLGLLDPTFAPGEVGAISALDVLAMDVIGWDPITATNGVPEPSSIVLLLIGLAWFARHRRRVA